MQLDYVTYDSDELMPSSIMASRSRGDMSAAVEDLLDFNLDVKEHNAPSSGADGRCTPAPPNPNAAVLDARKFLAAAINGTALPVSRTQTRSEACSWRSRRPENANRGSQTLERLGGGRCGVVFSIPDTGLVIKQSISVCAWTKRDRFDIHNDAAMHRLVEGAFRKAEFTAVHVPRLLDFVAAREFELKMSLLEAKGLVTAAQRARLAEGSKKLILAEKVPALEGRIRDAVRESFCLEETVRNLMQPLLGRRRSGLGEETMRADEETVRLGDFKLCADQMAVIGVDMKTVAMSLGQALAVLHWVAKVDALGVKFVFAGQPTNIHYSEDSIGRYQRPSDRSLGGSAARRSRCPEQGMNRGGRRVHLWLLDFHEVSPIPAKVRFVQMAVHGFVASKAYYPRPALDGTLTAEDHKNWQVFKEAYLAKCSEVRGGLHDGFPEAFLFHVEEHYLLRRESKLRD